ncbi:hypothetical protein CBF34_00825 [Vagococcus penaei]|uniref:Uncharacterized protein n=2 Tax=Vagococcus TaxID=2737 RepID=A0AAW8UBM8_9ENTE|nr:MULTISPECIES: hypothetical protein [Vagococcus]AQP54629.1 hypothetical protein BW732_10715 [Vagococcus penaei]MDT2834400.1 hypothetical protein [Vagococcus carniphilus]RSU06658.1 hypothetical protein CBF34_00825 [Vagococcus penaei]
MSDVSKKTKAENDKMLKELFEKLDEYKMEEEEVLEMLKKVFNKQGSIKSSIRNIKKDNEKVDRE